MIDLSSKSLKEVRERILGDPLTKQWFEHKTLERLYEVEIIIFPRRTPMGTLIYEYPEKRCLIREDVAEALPKEYSGVAIERILHQLLLGMGYFDLRNKNFYEILGSKLESLNEELRQIKSKFKLLIEEHLDQSCEKIFGRGNPIILDVKPLYKETTNLTKPTPFPLQPGTMPEIPYVKNLFFKYENERSVAVTYFFSEEKARREGRNSKWSLMKYSIFYTCLTYGTDLCPYLLTWQRSKSGKDFIGRLEDFRLGEDSSSSRIR